MNISEILSVNELAIDKWVNKPKLSPDMTIIDKVKLLHDTKRFFIVSELKKYQQDLGRPIRVLDFGSGQGGLTIDVKIAMGDTIKITGYDVSPKATGIARNTAKKYDANVDFILDTACEPPNVVNEKFDAIISCDVFGHVPSIPQTFKQLNDLLLPGGKLIAFSETITGDALIIPKMLARHGFRMDNSIEEHISLHSVHELKYFLTDSHFVNPNPLLMMSMLHYEVFGYNSHS